MLQIPEIRFTILGDLMKYKLSLAVTFSAGTGYFLFRNSFDSSFVPLLTGVFLLASGSAALNQYTERVQDSKMDRTMGRALPSKKITLPVAGNLIAVLMVSGCCLLLLNGIAPLVLGITTVILYNLVYTSLKKTTTLAIIPGALVGAIPPIIGFTSAGGGILDTKILLFSTFMFLWQMPHFWLLLIRYGDEYRNAGFVTISDYLNNKQIRNIVFFWILLTSFFLMFFFGFTNLFGKYFSYIVLILNPVFIVFFSRLLFFQQPNYMKRAFIMINVFSILIMLLLIVDSLLTGV